MDNKQFIILIVVVLICCCIVAGAIYFGLSNQKPPVNATANLTADNNTTNITEDVQSSNQSAVDWAHENQVDGVNRYQSDRADESINKYAGQGSHGGPGSGHCPACDPYA